MTTAKVSQGQQRSSMMSHLEKFPVTYMAFPADEMPLTQAKNITAHSTVLHNNIGQTILTESESPHPAKSKVSR